MAGDGWEPVAGGVRTRSPSRWALDGRLRRRRATAASRWSPRPARRPAEIAGGRDEGLRAAVPRARDGAGQGRPVTSTASASAGTPGARPTGTGCRWRGRSARGWTRRSPCSSAPSAPKASDHARRRVRAVVLEGSPPAPSPWTSRGSRPTYDADGHQRRAGLELWPTTRRTATRAAGPARSSVRHVARPRRAAAGLRVLPLADGGPRGRRPLRRAAPHLSIEAVVCDFGGVLTSPLMTASFVAVAEDSGSRSTPSARRWRASTERDGVHPLHRWSAGDHRARVPRRPRRRPRAALGAPSRSTASPPRYFERAEPERGDDRVRSRTGRRAAFGWRSARTTWASGSRTGGRCCRSTSSSRSSSTPASSACASRTRGSTRSSSSGCGLPAPGLRVRRRPRRNCEGARAAGMHAVHFGDTAQAIAEIEAALTR